MGLLCASKCTALNLSRMHIYAELVDYSNNKGKILERLSDTFNMSVFFDKYLQTACSVLLKVCAPMENCIKYLSVLTMYHSDWSKEENTKLKLVVNALLQFFQSLSF